MHNVDPYAVLDIAPNATPEEVRAAFRRAVRQRHPDTSSAATDGSPVRRVIDAYRLLIDPTARARYDATRTQLPIPAPAVRPVEVGYQSSNPPSNWAVTRCPSCRGTGIARTTTRCPACDGRAEITTLETGRARVLRCRTCRGLGEIRSLHRCSICGGTGVTRTGD